MTDVTKNTPPHTQADVTIKSDSSLKGKPTGEAATGLRELMLDEIKDIYWAEQALTKALPDMAKNATDEALRTALEKHLEETHTHVMRLQQVFELLNETAEAKKCEAMAGLLKEGEEIMQNTASGPVRDAGIISAGQKVEHYEIATYGTLSAFAKLLGENDVVGMLDMTLQEEKAADSTLTLCAQSSINLEAATENGEM